MIRYLIRDDSRIAYRQTSGSAPHVVFLGGFHSSMEGSKATALERWCQQQCVGFTRFDYFGHGLSDGRVEDGCISRWLEDSLAIIDQTSGPLILVGSSMGGWLMLLCALERPDSIAALLGIASAPDFTERGIWQSLSSAKQDELTTNGFVERPSRYQDEPYRISRLLIEDGRRHLLLDQRIGIHCPVRLIHGRCDEDVSFESSVLVQQQLDSEDVVLHSIDDGDHRLSRDRDITVITDVLESLVNAVGTNS